MLEKVIKNGQSREKATLWTQYIWQLPISQTKLGDLLFLHRFLLLLLLLFIIIIIIIIIIPLLLLAVNLFDQILKKPQNILDVVVGSQL
jgi:hypothetical protein